jgi:dTDP-4-dehydrorhamnose reductase
MKKILIVGSKGMAGHMLYHYIKENTTFDIIDIARGAEFHTPSYQLDVTDFSNLEAMLKKEAPDYVINCIGVLNKNAEEHPDNAVLLNSYFPHFLAAKGTELGFKLIHISTDCVFNGQKGGYTETSVKDGFGFYAQSKALGEVEYGNHLTFRTSIIGPDLNKNGIGLFHWFMNQKGIIKGYSEAYWTGVTTLELAKAVVEAIAQNLTGLHHLVNDQKINKYELTNLFKLIFDKDDVEIEAYNGYKVDKSLVRTNFEFNYTVKPYAAMIDEMRNWIMEHPDLYAY